MARKKFGGPLGPVIDVLSSFGLACVLLLLLFVLVFAATLRYKLIGEAGVKQEYFIPWIAHVGNLPVPGGRTVFSLLALNLFTGGLVRIRWGWRTAGVIVAHIGIVGMVVAGVVNFTLSDYGYLKMYEGETDNSYDDFTSIELSVWDAAQKTEVHELVISDADLRSCADQGRTFSSEELPFDLEVSGFLSNCQPLPKGPMWEAASPVVEGWALKAQDTGGDPHHFNPGAVVRVTTPAGTSVGLLSSRDVCAWTVEAEGKQWALHLHHLRHRLPFTIHVEDAYRENYPGTNTPRVYHSDVIYRTDGPGQKRRISMNQPLRTQGHVLFQSGWGIDRVGEWTGFSVTRNPSDQWPLWSMLVILAGLLIAFVQKLYQYITAQARLRAREET